jgi:hypothetical protein
MIHIYIYIYTVHPHPTPQIKSNVAHHCIHLDIFIFGTMWNQPTAAPRFPHGNVWAAVSSHMAPPHTAETNHA